MAYRLRARYFFFFGAAFFATFFAGAFFLGAAVYEV